MFGRDRIYLDYNASTPVAPQVAEAIRGFLADEEGFGYPFQSGERNHPGGNYSGGQPPEAGGRAKTGRKDACLKTPRKV